MGDNFTLMNCENCIRVMAINETKWTLEMVLLGCTELTLASVMIEMIMEANEVATSVGRLGRRLCGCMVPNDTPDVLATPANTCETKVDMTLSCTHTGIHINNL